VAVRADSAMRGFAICSLTARRVALSACLCELLLCELLLDIIDDDTLSNLGTVNPIHTGWNTPGHPAVGRTALVESQSSQHLAKIDQQQLPCQLSPSPTQVFEVLGFLDV